MGATGLYGAGTRRHIRAGRAALLASSALALASTWPAARPALAQDATWLGSPGTADFNTGANWGPGTVPTGTAFFGASDTTALSFSADTTVGGLTFNAGDTFCYVPTYLVPLRIAIPRQQPDHCVFE